MEAAEVSASESVATEEATIEAARAHAPPTHGNSGLSIPNRHQVQSDRQDH